MVREGRALDDRRGYAGLVQGAEDAAGMVAEHDAGADRMADEGLRCADPLARAEGGLALPQSTQDRGEHAVEPCRREERRQVVRAERIGGRSAPRLRVGEEQEPGEGVPADRPVAIRRQRRTGERIACLGR